MTECLTCFNKFYNVSKLLHTKSDRLKGNTLYKRVCIIFILIFNSKTEIVSQKGHVNHPETLLMFVKCTLKYKRDVVFLFS